MPDIDVTPWLVVKIWNRNWGQHDKPDSRFWLSLNQRSLKNMLNFDVYCDNTSLYRLQAWCQKTFITINDSPFSLCTKPSCVRSHV